MPGTHTKQPTECQYLILKAPNRDTVDRRSDYVATLREADRCSRLCGLKFAVRGWMLSALVLSLSGSGYLFMVFTMLSCVVVAFISSLTSTSRNFCGSSSIYFHTARSSLTFTSRPPRGSSEIPPLQARPNVQLLGLSEFFFKNNPGLCNAQSCVYTGPAAGFTFLVALEIDCLAHVRSNIACLPPILLLLRQ